MATAPTHWEQTVVATGSLFSHIVECALKQGKEQRKSVIRMTKGERETIALIAEGFSNKEIARQLDIAAHTVKSLVHNIMNNVTLHTRPKIADHAHDEAMF